MKKFSFVNNLVMRKCSLKCRIEKRSFSFKSNPLKRSYDPRLSEWNLPPPIWRTFFRQQEAFDFANTKDSVKIFSFEPLNDSNCGTRRYVVTSVIEFWHYYKQIPHHRRHFYEVIAEGIPSRLYFDLEFDRTLNVDCDGQGLVDLWISFISYCIEEQFQIKTTQSNVVMLTSTTENKFSQHLIWHLPGAVFKNNIEVGIFVRSACKSLKLYINETENYCSSFSASCRKLDRITGGLSKLLVNNSAGEKILFVDEGVYSKNRNFRLLFSSKKGRPTVLEYCSSCQFCINPADISTSWRHLQEDKLFFASLVTDVHIKNDTKLLQMPSDKKEFINTNSTINVSRCFPLATNTRYNVTSAKGKNALTCLPYELNEFITIYIKQFNNNAYINKVSFSPDGPVLFFDISGTRYCPSIGREHKSNGIFIVVNLNKKLCYHRCYDQDCRAKDVKQEPFPLKKSISESEEFLSFVNILTSDTTDGELLDFVQSIEANTSNNSN